MLWGGLPRTLFIVMLALSALMVMFFRTPKALLPIGIIYFILVMAIRYDPNYLTILWRHFKTKDAYFPD